MHDLGRVSFEQVTHVLGAADILVLPMTETPLNLARWPHKFGDYLAAGRPIATTRVGDIGRDVSNNAIGAAGEPTGEGLAAAIAQIISNPAEWDAMGRRGREMAETTHSWPTRFGGLADFLAGHGLDV
jgi:glycosyltransferase involved in cell wall biosynthesis